MQANQLKSVEIKAFIPAKDFQQSKAFYRALGFTLASDEAGVAYFYHGNTSFLLQDFYQPELADNLMMHFLVEDIEAWHQFVQQQQLCQSFAVKVSAIVEQPWGMREFQLFDPSGVLWRIAENN